MIRQQKIEEQTFLRADKKICNIQRNEKIFFFDEKRNVYIMKKNFVVKKSLKKNNNFKGKKRMFEEERIFEANIIF